MSENDSSEGVTQQKAEKPQEQQQPNSKRDQQTVADLASHQAQMGLNVFWLVQQAAALQQQQIEEGTSSSTFPSDYPSLTLYSAFSNALGLGKLSSPPICSPLIPPTQQQQANGVDSNEEKRRRDLAIIGKRWEYVNDVQSFSEFEQLRCRHQVSRNRTFAHGIRYSCTQKTQLRSNCPYLLLCLFSDGAGEHSAPGVGTISVYSRNKHTHPVKVIKARQPRRFAKLAKKERKGYEEGEEEGEKQGKKSERIGGHQNGGKGEEDENGTKKEGANELGKTGEALIEILSKVLAEQQRDEGAKNDEHFERS